MNFIYQIIFIKRLFIFIITKIILKLQMTKALLLILSCLLISNIVFGVEIKRNTKDLIFQKPKLIAQVPNGQKLLIGDLNDPEKNILYLANLKGTPFQMGEAYGKLFKD